MKALSIRQPWAWLIIHGGKDVENRSWHTKHRGRFLVHAAKGMTKHEYQAARDYARECGVEIPALRDRSVAESLAQSFWRIAGIRANRPGTWEKKRSCWLTRSPCRSCH
ncbi:ASCH domain protein [compost metagenome]